jgi:hypothetical protein
MAMRAIEKKGIGNLPRGFECPWLQVDDNQILTAIHYWWKIKPGKQENVIPIETTA